MNTNPFAVARNSFLIFAGQIFTKLLGLLSAILLANYLGAGLFGAYNYGFALASLFIPLCDLGMDTFLLREVSQSRGDPASMDTVLAGKGILTVLAFLMLCAVAGLVDSSEYFPIIVLAAAVTFLRTYWTTFSSMFRGINRVPDEVMIFSLTRIAEFLIIGAAIVLRRDMFFLLPGLAVVNLVSVIVTAVILRSPGFPGLIVRFRDLAKFLKGGLPFALTTIFVAIYFNLDTVLVKKMISDSAAGIYRAAYNLILPLLMVTASVTGAVFPFVSRNYQTDKGSVDLIVRESVFYLLMIGLPVALIGTLFPGDIIRFLFKPEYAAASVSLMILVWFLPIAYITNLFGNVLGAMDDQPFVLKVAVVNVVFNVAANIVVIPLYAQNGAAVVTVLTELLGLCFLQHRIRQRIGPVLQVKRAGKLIAASAVMVPFAFLRIALPFTLGLAVMTYVSALLIVRAVSYRELRQLILIIRGNYESRRI